MIHAREDYDRIQDDQIPADEPVFLLRGQDRTAAAVVRYWAELNTKLPDGDMQAVGAAREHAELMDRWPKHKTADLRRPDPATLATLPLPDPATFAKVYVISYDQKVFRSLDSAKRWFLVRQNIPLNDWTQNNSHGLSWTSRRGSEWIVESEIN
jgi:hypothetical protein